MSGFEMFCERCGKRYGGEEASAEPSLPLARRLLVAVGVATEAPRPVAEEPHLRFCLACRGYTCDACWNEEAGFCQTCVPLPEPVVVEPAVIEPVAVEPAMLEPVAVEPAALEPVAARPFAEALTPMPIAGPIPEVAGEPVSEIMVEPFDEVVHAHLPSLAQPADSDTSLTWTPAVPSLEPWPVQPRLFDPALADPIVAEPHLVEEAVGTTEEVTVAFQESESLPLFDRPRVDAWVPEPAMALDTESEPWVPEPAEPWVFEPVSAHPEAAEAESPIEPEPQPALAEPVPVETEPFAEPEPALAETEQEPLLTEPESVLTEREPVAEAQPQPELIAAAEAEPEPEPVVAAQEPPVETQAEPVVVEPELRPAAVAPVLATEADWYTEPPPDVTWDVTVEPEPDWSALEAEVEVATAPVEIAEEMVEPIPAETQVAGPAAEPPTKPAAEPAQPAAAAPAAPTPAEPRVEPVPPAVPMPPAPQPPAPVYRPLPPLGPIVPPPPPTTRPRIEFDLPASPPAYLLGRQEPPAAAPRPQLPAGLFEGPGPIIRPCAQCDLPVSAKARFCRRCGSAQPPAPA